MANKLRKEIEQVEQRVEERAVTGERGFIKLGSGVLIFVFGAAVAGIALTAIEPAASPQPAGSDAPVISAAFTPPPLSALPPGAEGDSIKRGLAIFTNTGVNARAFVGNSMACSNCHLDAGRRANSSPMWAAWVAYPQYRKKTNSINTMQDRIRGCFNYSMNAPNSPSGAAPPDGSDVYRDLEAYFHWLARGAATGSTLAGAGYVKPKLGASGYDPKRGAQLFQAQCVACHGADGQGASQPDGKIVYPPLWGPRSFNWGAGLARVDLAAGFIKANMPQGQGNSLTDQQAWDVAAFVDSHERPKDPRQTGSVAQNAAANFKDQKSYYGQTVDGRQLGIGVAGAR